MEKASKTRVLQGQSWLDLAIMHTGNVENAFLLAKENGQSITAELEAGTEVFLSENLVLGSEIKNYYQNKSLQPATEYTTENAVLGIGKMQIESTFIIK